MELTNDEKEMFLLTKRFINLDSKVQGLERLSDRALESASSAQKISLENTKTIVELRKEIKYMKEWDIQIDANTMTENTSTKKPSFWERWGIK